MRGIISYGLLNIIAKKKWIAKKLEAIFKLLRISL
jgi:hypothetical protein